MGCRQLPAHPPATLTLNPPVADAYFGAACCFYNATGGVFVGAPGVANDRGSVFLFEQVAWASGPNAGDPRPGRGRRFRHRGFDLQRGQPARGRRRLGRSLLGPGLYLRAGRERYLSTARYPGTRQRWRAVWPRHRHQPRRPDALRGHPHLQRHPSPSRLHPGLPVPKRRLGPHREPHPGRRLGLGEPRPEPGHLRGWPAAHGGYGLHRPVSTSTATAWRHHRRRERQPGQPRRSGSTMATRANCLSTAPGATRPRALSRQRPSRWPQLRHLPRHGRSRRLLQCPGL
jgi:hypothetical protein